MDTRHERWIVSAKTDRSPFHRSCSLLQCFWICVGMCTSISIKCILYQMYLYMYLHVYIIHILNNTYIYTYNIYMYTQSKHLVTVFLPVQHIIPPAAASALRVHLPKRGQWRDVTGWWRGIRAQVGPGPLILCSIYIIIYIYIHMIIYI